LGSISMTAKILTVQFSFGDKKLLVVWRILTPLIV
jgi:hypothetical protein